MASLLDCPARKVDFSVGTDHIVVEVSGDSLHIDDSQVLGVSSHLVTEETLDYERPTPKRRYVDIEFFDETQRARVVTVDEPDELNAQLPDYVERVAVFAKDNTLTELLQNDTVTRKGFTITDQGMMVTAHGQPIWFALPDLDACDLTQDAVLIWQRGTALPIARITVEDPNAAVLALVIPQLLQANATQVAVTAEQTGVRYMVDAIECKAAPHRQAKHRMMIAALLGVTVSIAGLALNLLGWLPGLTGATSVIVPIAGLLWLYYQRQSKTLLFVYRDGLSVVETRKSSDIEVFWSDLETSTIQQERIQIPTTYRLPDHIFTEVRLTLRSIGQANGEPCRILAWNLDEENVLVTNYLFERLSNPTPQVLVE